MPWGIWEGEGVAGAAGVALCGKGVCKMPYEFLAILCPRCFAHIRKTRWIYNSGFGTHPTLATLREGGFPTILELYSGLGCLYGRRALIINI